MFDFERWIEVIEIDRIIEVEIIPLTSKKMLLRLPLSDDRPIRFGHV